MIIGVDIMNNRGQTLVEFVLILPVFLLILFYVIDFGRIIYSKNIHNVRSVASISKIMTALLAVESGKLDDEVKINSSINKAYGSAIYIKVGEKMRLRDLVYGLMLRSGNELAMTE